MLKQKKTQNGITLIALVVTVIVLIILAGVSIAMLVGENGIITKAQQAKTETEQAQKDEEAGLFSLETQIEEALGNVYNEEKGVNKPKLTSGMTPIKFTDPTNSEKGIVVETTSDDTNWYNYDEKRWANAQTEDGSMWVWIPRFAYRVNESTRTFDIVFLVGTTDTYYDENGEEQTAKRCTSEDELVDTSTGYTVHPAFTDETNINYRNGGWDKEITGIWVAKFEAGYASGNNNAPVKASSVNYLHETMSVYAVERGETSSGVEEARNWLDGIYGDTITSIKYPTFQSLTYSMNYISQGEAYSIAKVLTGQGNIYGLTQSTNSHLMKNSEWGAVAYLSKSKYGLEGEDITPNNVNLLSGNKQRTDKNGRVGVDSVYTVTGCTTAQTTGDTKVTTMEVINNTERNESNDGVYTWNQKTGTKASCTGTIYGIYDLSGGFWEYTSAYIANGTENLKEYGESISYNNNVLKTTSTKYTTVYLHDVSDTGMAGLTDTEKTLISNKNYSLNAAIYGDAIQETSTGHGIQSWYGDYSYFPRLDRPFFTYGSHYWDISGCGLFSFSRVTGANNYGGGFRVTLIVK